MATQGASGAITDVLPFTPAAGFSVIGVLTLIIIYLLRLNAVDRRDNFTRLTSLETEHGEAITRERNARDVEREWLQGFYEGRLEIVTKRYEAEVTALRTEVRELRDQLQTVSAAVDHERHLRYEVEEKLARTEATVARLQS